MIMKPSITTIIPTFNRSNLLVKAIKSVQSQTYKNLNITIVDDASIDNTQEAINKIQADDIRINYYKNEQNIGYLQNFKKCFELINTEYFSTIADDDLLHPDFYEYGINFLEQNKDTDFVILITLPINSSGEIIEPVKNFPDEFKKFSAAEGFQLWLDGKLPIMWAGMIFKNKCKHLYADMDHHNFDTGHDMRYLLRVFSRCNGAISGKVGAFYRFHDENLSSQVINRFSISSQIIRSQRFIEIIDDKKVNESVKKLANSQLLKIKIPDYKGYVSHSLKNIFNKLDTENIDRSALIEKYSFGPYGNFFKLFINLLAISFIRTSLIKIFNRLKSQKEIKNKKLLSDVNKAFFNDISKIEHLL